MKFASVDEVAKRIRRARPKYFDSQGEFAEAVGVGQSAVCAWENAEYLPGRDRWDLVASKLRTTTSALFLDHEKRGSKRRAVNNG